MTAHRELHCAFCHRPRSAVTKLAVAPAHVAGLPIAICADCALSAALDMWGPGEHPAEPATQPGEAA